MTIDTREAIAFVGQVDIEGAQHRLVRRLRDPLPVGDHEVAMKMIELQKEALPIEGATGGEISGPQGLSTLLMKEDDQVACLAVESGRLIGAPARSNIKKMPLQGHI